MYSSAQAQKLRVYVRNKKDRLKKYGKVHQVIFHPSKPLAIGIAVKRPDFLLMKKREDRFVSLDRLKRIDEGLEVEGGSDSWGNAACKRLGVDYDQCIIWDYMDVRTLSGADIGLVKDVFFEEDSFKVAWIDISPSSANRAILGASRVPVEMIRGYRDGAIVVADEAKELEEAGGLAARAGEAWAKGKHSVGESQNAATAKAEELGEKANEGAYKAGKSLGDQRKKMNDAFDEHQAKKEAEQKSGNLTGVDKAANDLGKQLGKAGRALKRFKAELDDSSKDD